MLEESSADTWDHKRETQVGPRANEAKNDKTGDILLWEHHEKAMFLEKIIILGKKRRQQK